MAREVEVKILEINRKEIVRNLKKMKARKIFEGAIEAVYFDDSKSRLKKGGEVLRLRKKGKNVEMTVKKRRHGRGAKVMDEYEVQTGDFNQAKKILSQLDFKEIRRFRKRRSSYSLGKVHFEIDKYPRIPAFLEIEAASLKKVKAVLQRLGYSLKDTKPWSTFELFEYYRKR